MRARRLMLSVVAAALVIPAGAAGAGADVPEGEPLYFSASLTGWNEVPTPGGPAVGAPGGTAKGFVEVNGSEVTFAFSWKGIEAPTAGHIHAGAAGTNGPVVLGLITAPMPAGSTATAGTVTLNDPALAAGIEAHPERYYLNLHSASFPGGAVRGQLRTEWHGQNPLRLLGSLPLQAEMDGAQEVPGPGDPDGFAVGLARASGANVRYAFAWLGVSPNNAHIHAGTAGVAGPVVVPLFTGAVPAGIFAVAGEVGGLTKAVRNGLRDEPEEYYLNLHSAEFPAGAVRGQLSGD